MLDQIIARPDHPPLEQAARPGPNSRDRSDQMHDQNSLIRSKCCCTTREKGHNHKRVTASSRILTLPREHRERNQTTCSLACTQTTLPREHRERNQTTCSLACTQTFQSDGAGVGFSLTHPWNRSILSHSVPGENRNHHARNNDTPSGRLGGYRGHLRHSFAQKTLGSLKRFRQVSIEMR